MNATLKKQLLYSLTVLFMLGACGDEDELSPSDLRNWYVIQDSENEVIHRTYELYKQYGVLIYVNDTLGSENRGKDDYGNDVIYDEILNPFYEIFSIQDYSHYAVCHDEHARLKAVNAVGKYVLPNLTPRDNRTILLCDTLVTPDYGGRPELNAWVFSSPICLAAGKLYEMNSWSDQKIRFWAGMILAPEVYDWFNAYCEDEMVQFTDITGSKENGDPYYGESFYYYVTKYYDGIMAYRVDAAGNDWKQLHMKFENFQFVGNDGDTTVFHLDKFGVLDFPTREEVKIEVNQAEVAWLYPLSKLDPTLELANPDTLVQIVANHFQPFSDITLETVNRHMPTMQLDVMNYIAAVYAYDEAEFREIYCTKTEVAEKCIAKYELVDLMLKKYEAAKGITRKPFYEIP